MLKYRIYRYVGIYFGYFVIFGILNTDVGIGIGIFKYRDIGIGIPNHDWHYTSQRGAILSAFFTLYCSSLCLLREYNISLFLFSETNVYFKSTHNVCAGDPVCI